MTGNAQAKSQSLARLLGIAFFAAVMSLAWLRFSENTADNDLWGHVLYGQRYWNLGQVRCGEAFSWTAPGFPVVNHEWLAEVIVGHVHRIGGGQGLWLYMVAMAAFTLLPAMMVARGHNNKTSLAALALLGASTNFIALGFAVRPQLFTTLCLVVELLLLRRFMALGEQHGAGNAQRDSLRQLWPLLPLPLLCGLWINLHGGVLAGMFVLTALVGVSTAGAFLPARLTSAFPGWEFNRLSKVKLCGLWGALLACAAALLANPWGVDLLRWNVEASFRPRPMILEWHPMVPSFANLPYFVVLAVSILAWLFSRLTRRPWEAAVLAMLALMGLLHQRHAPLFGVANLLFTTPHLADAALRLAPRLGALRKLASVTAVQATVAAGLLVVAGWCAWLSVSSPRSQPFTIEVERDMFPCAAIAHMKERNLEGRTITFFDWGQQFLWELPRNPVSFDGRFDTGYPPAVYKAHWDFYAGKGFVPGVDWTQADLALLPTSNPGALHLLRSGDWLVSYRDPLAIVLVRRGSRHETTVRAAGTVVAGNEALLGRERFPDALPTLAWPHGK